MPVSHGVLVLWGGSGFGLVNLTTATLSQLSLPARAPIGLGFSWPYLVYADHPDLGGPITVRAHDLATGADRALPQVDALYAAANTGGANHQPYLALAGDTLFVSLATGRIQSSSIPPNNVTGPDAATTLYEMDHLFAAGAQLRPVARYHGVAESPVGANDRLVVFGFVAWDRAQDRFVTYPPPPPDGLEPPAALSGNALTLTTQTVSATGSWVAEQVTIYDTALLRTAGS